MLALMLIAKQRWLTNDHLGCYVCSDHRQPVDLCAEVGGKPLLEHSRIIQLCVECVCYAPG